MTRLVSWLLLIFWGQDGDWMPGRTPRVPLTTVASSWFSSPSLCGGGGVRGAVVLSRSRQWRGKLWEVPGSPGGCTYFSKPTDPLLTPRGSREACDYNEHLVRNFLNFLLISQDPQVILFLFKNLTLCLSWVFSIEFLKNYIKIFFMTSGILAPL